MTAVKDDTDQHSGADHLVPEGWASTNLACVADSLTYGYTASATAGSNGPRFLRITDIQDGRVQWNSVPTCDIEEREVRKYNLRPGDIVFARTGATTGKSFLIRSCPPAVFASYLIRLRLLSGINPALLAHFFSTPDYWTFVSENVAGIAQPSCNATKLAELPIPIPPLAEQERLVEAIEACLSKVNSARDRLSRVPAILKRFRQAVLAAACSGGLTEDWRQTRSSSSLSSERLIQGLADACKRSNVQWLEPQFDHREHRSLPDGWNYVALGVLGSWASGGTPSKSKSAYWSQGDYPWVSPKDMKTDFLVDSQDHLTQLGASQLKVIPKHSILFVVRGMILAHTFPVGMAMRELTINQDIRAVTPHGGVVPPFLLRALQHEAMSILFAVRESTHGTRRLESETLKAWPVPLPSSDEQQEIVRRVDGLFQVSHTIDRYVSSAAVETDKLTQSILTKAFRGELVPTEAELARREGRDYEPASVLLERIKAGQEPEISSKVKAKHAHERARWQPREDRYEPTRNGKRFS